MNVTLKLPDDLCKQARHRAVDESKSLSAWLADLVRRELSAKEVATEKPRTLIDAFSSDYPDWFYEKDFLLEKSEAEKIRNFSFGEEK